MAQLGCKHHWKPHDVDWEVHRLLCSRCGETVVEKHHWDVEVGDLETLYDTSAICTVCGRTEKGYTRPDEFQIME
jgi:hypothetical protein